MSVEPTALERSALEKKDRSELFTIAEALGGKPGSRARKADMIDLILELTGVQSDDTGADDAAAAQSGSDGVPADAVVDSSAPAGGGGGDGTDPGADRSPAQEQRAQEQEAQDQRGQGGNDQRASQQGQGGNQQGGDQQAQGGNQQAQGGNQQAQGGNQQGQGDDGEGGNRRRRRRGRNRERGGDPPNQQDEFTGEPVSVEGLLDLRDEGYGFLRLAGYLPSKDDVYV
jgi:transcription termination factor Rho